MQNRQNDSRQHAVRRGAVALGILVAHAGLVVLIVYSATKSRPEVALAPVTVSFLQSNEPQLEAPQPSEPQLAAIHPALNTPTPELDLPADPTTAAITAAIADTPPSPAAAPQQAPHDEVPAMSDVAYLRQPSPHYPSDSRRAREEGLVILRVLIDKAGHVKSVDVYRSSGHPRLDDAAREAVARALFKPYINGGVACMAFAMIPIEFSLHTAPS